MMFSQSKTTHCFWISPYASQMEHAKNLPQQRAKHVVCGHGLQMLTALKYQAARYTNEPRGGSKVTIRRFVVKASYYCTSQPLETPLVVLFWHSQLWLPYTQ